MQESLYLTTHLTVLLKSDPVTILASPDFEPCRCHVKMFPVKFIFKL